MNTNRAQCFQNEYYLKRYKLLFGLISYQASIGLVSDFFAGVDANGKVVGVRVSTRTGNMGIETRSLFCNFLPFASAVLAWRLQKMTSFLCRRQSGRTEEGSTQLLAAFSYAKILYLYSKLHETNLGESVKVHQICLNRTCYAVRVPERHRFSWLSSVPTVSIWGLILQCYSRE